MPIFTFDRSLGGNDPEIDALCASLSGQEFDPLGKIVEGDPADPDFHLWGRFINGAEIPIFDTEVYDWIGLVDCAPVIDAAIVKPPGWRWPT